MDKGSLTKALEQNPQKTIRDAERLNAELSRRAQKIADSAESGRTTTVDVEITYGWKITFFESNIEAFLFLGLGKEALDREGFYSVETEGFDEVNKALRKIKTDGDQKKNFRYAAGAYNSSQKVLCMRRMAEDQLKDLRNSYPEFKSLFDFVSTETVHSTISHELTHAYIDENTGFNASGDKYNRDAVGGGKRAKLTAIDEAAAQFTGTLLGEKPSDPSNYKRKGFSRSEMHTAENLLAGKVDGVENVDEKIDQIRKTAARGIRRIQRHPSFDIIQAIDAEELERAKAFRQAVYYMKAAERNSADVLDKLNLLDREIEREMRELEDEIDLEYHNELKQIFPKDTPLDNALDEEADVELDEEIMGAEDDLDIGPSQQSFSEDISLDEEFEELEDFQFNETLTALENSREKLVEIARKDDLTQEEVQSLEETEQEIGSLVQLFRDEIDQKREKLETENRSFASPKNTSQWIINNPQALQQAEKLLKRYQRLIATGLKICQQGTEALSKVHDREETSAQLMKKYSEKEEYRVIGDAIQYTGDSYRALKAGDQILRQSHRNVKLARKSLQKTLSS